MTCPRLPDTRGCPWGSAPEPAGAEGSRRGTWPRPRAPGRGAILARLPVCGETGAGPRCRVYRFLSPAPTRLGGARGPSAPLWKRVSSPLKPSFLRPAETPARQPSPRPRVVGNVPAGGSSREGGLLRAARPARPRVALRRGICVASVRHAAPRPSPGHHRPRRRVCSPLPCSREPPAASGPVLSASGHVGGWKLWSYLALPGGCVLFCFPLLRVPVAV